MIPKIEKLVTLVKELFTKGSKEEKIRIFLQVNDRTSQNIEENLSNRGENEKKEF